MMWARIAEAAAVGALALVLTLDASVEEFAALIALSEEARRERFDLPATCTPVISAVRPRAPHASRLTVFVRCGAPAAEPTSPVEPATWKTK